MENIWGEFFRTVLLFICGAGGLALINILQERWKWRHERKAVKEDRKEQKNDEIEKLTKLVEGLAKQQEETAEQLDSLRDAQKCVLLDRIIYLGQSYIKSGEIDFDDRRRLREMHHSYHHRLGGNGDADAIMAAVDKLPLKNH